MKRTIYTTTHRENKSCRANLGTKAVSVILVFATILSMLSLVGCSTNSKRDTAVNIDQIVAEEVVDGTTVRCEYDISDNQYSLKLDSYTYPLQVDVVDDYAYISFVDTEMNVFLEDEVVAQSAIALSAPYWAPAVIAAAKTLIIKVIAATATIVGAYYSADVIANTIAGVKTNAISKSKARAKSAVSAWTAVKASTTTNGKQYYYEAVIYNGQIMIGANISYKAAVARLKSGCDVFASSRDAAKLVAGAAANPRGTVYEHRAHGSGENHFKHFHPAGRTWRVNRRHMPHCWYPG